MTNADRIRNMTDDSIRSGIGGTEMTEREAIKYGKDYLNDLCNAACEVSDKHKDFVKMAIQALEKQIPKKIVLVNRPFAYVKVRVCPSCSTPEKYYPLFSKLNYCANCGQKIDWSDDDE